MKIVAFDSETHRFRPGMVCPLPVCLTWTDDGDHASILNRDDGRVWLLERLKEAVAGKILLVGHNTPFDLSVFAAGHEDEFLPLISEGIERGTVKDTLIRQTLIDIAKGEHKYRIVRGDRQKTDYKLSTLVNYYTGRTVDKGEDNPLHPRLRYGELDGVELSAWPSDFLTYALNDAIETWQLWKHQHEHIGGDDVPNETEQNEAAWSLRLCGIWGLRSNAVKVADFRERTQKIYDQMYRQLAQKGIVRADGTRDMALIGNLVEAAYEKNGRECPKTPKGKPKTSEEVLSESGDEDLERLGATSEIRTALSRYIPMLELGVSVPMTPGWISLLETGRVAARDPNPLNPPRNSLSVTLDGVKMEMGDTRDCFAPRGVYVSSDYDGAELRSWCQVCIDLLGYSTMADAIAKGVDIHLRLASQILNISYEEAKQRFDDGDEEVTNTRQFCKVPNFGLIGGMGPDRLCGAFKDQAGLIVSRDFCVRVITAWKNTWAEAGPYLRHIGSKTAHDYADAIQLRSGRMRGRLGYCDLANGYFQALTADGAKAAMWEITKECYGIASKKYTAKQSPMFGARMVLFLHDEFILEALEARAADVAVRLGEIMVEQMKRYLPDVEVGTTPVITRTWIKGARPVFVNGVQVPSKKQKIDGKTVWVADLRSSL